MITDDRKKNRAPARPQSATSPSLRSGRCRRARERLRDQPSPGPPGATAPAVVHYEMEPMSIEATRGAEGVTVESFDAEELFEQGGAALSAGRHDDAIRYYDRLLAKFPASHYARSALYNRGLAHTEKKEWQKAIDSFRELAEKYGDHTDAKDALFQLGACFAELGNWPASTRSSSACSSART